jgi:hypothetical protein
MHRQKTGMGVVEEFKNDVIAHNNDVQWVWYIKQVLCVYPVLALCPSCIPEQVATEQA